MKIKEEKNEREVEEEKVEERRREREEKRDCLVFNADRSVLAHFWYSPCIEYQ